MHHEGDVTSNLYTDVPDWHVHVLTLFQQGASPVQVAPLPGARPVPQHVRHQIRRQVRRQLRRLQLDKPLLHPGDVSIVPEFLWHEMECGIFS